MRLARSAATCVAIGSVLAFAAPAVAASITEFPVETGAATGTHRPEYIASSPTGELWFTDLGTVPAVRSINTAGAALTSITSPPPSADLGFGPDGTLAWAVVAHGTGGFGTRSPAGVVAPHYNSDQGESYAIGFTPTGEVLYTAHDFDAGGFGVCTDAACSPQLDSRITDLTLGSDGRVWEMQPEGNAARRLDAGAGIADLTIDLPAGSHPGRAALGPDGNLWIAAFGNTFDSHNTLNQIIRLTPSGQQKSFMLPAGTGPNDITQGPDGALWFTEYLSNSIGRITTAGDYSSCPLPSAAAKPGPYGITTGADGALWFTEYNGGAIGRLAGNCAPAPLGGGAGGSGTGGGKDATKPTLGHLVFSSTSFRAARSGASTAGRQVTVGTKVTFSLSEDSAVKFTVQRKARGRRVGRRCKSPSHSNRGHRSCTRYVMVRGSFTIAGKNGVNTFTFRGRIGGQTLRPGAYRLSGQATDPSRNRSVPKNQSFRIVR